MRTTTVVIGAGHAGLAMSRCLTDHSRENDFEIKALRSDLLASINTTATSAPIADDLRVTDVFGTKV